MKYFVEIWEVNIHMETKGVENSNISDKQHWIKNTRLAKYCKEHDKIRKLITIIIVLITAILIINSICNLDELNSLKDANNANRAVGTTNIRLEQQINRIKFFIGGEWVLAFILMYYGSKIVEKR